jgi:protein-S-isoprenylcysteine O-methyltransferase Ste14
MARTEDAANVAFPPPIGWAIAWLVGLGLCRLFPLPFLPGAAPRVAAGVVVFALGLALFISAIATIAGAGSRVETHKPTTTIVSNGPYAFTRNPIYLAMFISLIGLAIAFNCAWIILMMIPFYLVIRYGVVAREETYLERKFGAAYLSYKSRVRRWL